jgi:hypothetical protein
LLLFTGTDSLPTLRKPSYKSNCFLFLISGKIWLMHENRNKNKFEFICKKYKNLEKILLSN